MDQQPFDDVLMRRSARRMAPVSSRFARGHARCPHRVDASGCDTLGKIYTRWALRFHTTGHPARRARSPGRTEITGSFEKARAELPAQPLLSNEARRAS